MAFEHANSECKRVIRPLKAGPAPLDEWLRNIAAIGSHAYGDALIEVILKIKMSDVLLVVNNVI